MHLMPGARLGAYEIVAPIGAGGMGEVYRARDARLGRDVAIKVLPPAVAADAAALARFEREARTIAALNHPNIVVLYSVEEDHGVRFLTMELVEGESLDRIVRPGGLSIEQTLDLMIPLADALSAAHERGVVHRDLKPSNVMVTREGRVKVLDFGLAKWFDDPPAESDAEQTTMASPRSGAGQVLGTVPYMAPEQIRSERIDARTDLFAFGILLFEIVAGRRPFQGATSADVMSSILRDVPTSLLMLRSDVPSQLAQLVAKILEKEPDRRVQSAREVCRELEASRRAHDVQSSPAPSPPVGAPSALDLPSIAVLPFANRSTAQEDEYFADGITEDVIAQLSKMPTLKVISRMSVMPFRHRDESLREIATRLQVTNVLEGSVRRIGDRVRIVAQLIDAASGQHLWAETYDRNLTDIFAIQMDVALQIATALNAELSQNERDRIRRQPTRDMAAYEYYLRGRHSLVEYTAEGLLRSTEHFGKAVERDPRFALAWVGLATAYTELGEHGTVGHETSRERAIAAATMAIGLAPELAEAHCAHAFARLVFEFDWAGAEAGFKRALELSPNSADAYDLYGRMCAGLQRFDEALVLHQRAHDLDPLTHRADLLTTMLRAGRYEESAQGCLRLLALEPRDARVHATLGWARFKQGRLDDGIAELEKAAAFAHEAPWFAQLGQAYALAGRTDQAREVLRRLQEPSRPAASPYHLAYVYTGLGELDSAIDSLERAFEDRTGALYGIKGSFLFAPLREHPRFIALLERMGLPGV